MRYRAASVQVLDTHTIQYPTHPTPLAEANTTQSNPGKFLKPLTRGSHGQTGEHRPAAG